MLYAHGSDLCHDTELRHAMANCFEALMGAIYLDGGIGKPNTLRKAALRNLSLLTIFASYVLYVVLTNYQLLLF